MVTVNFSDKQCTTYFTAYHYMRKEDKDVLHSRSYSGVSDDA